MPNIQSNNEISNKPKFFFFLSAVGIIFLIILYQLHKDPKRVIETNNTGQSIIQSSNSESQEETINNSPSSNRTFKEADIITYLISNNFSYSGNGLVTFTRNTVTVKGNGYTMIGDYRKVSENSVQFNLRVVDGNFDASRNRTTFGVFVRNPDGTLTETLSDGNNTRTYTLTPE